MRRRRVVVLVAIALISIAGILYASVSYHGPNQFSERVAQPIDRDRVVSAARALRGTMYDPLMGKLRNLGGRLGFIVCADVPVLAYGAAGFSLRAALAADFAEHPSHYDSRDWNVPSNPFFHRRSRNLYAFFKGTGRLRPPTETPLPGDLVFCKKVNDSYPTHVAVVTRADAPGVYWIVESAPETVLAGEVSSESLMARGWVPLGFGRLAYTEVAPHNSALSAAHSAVTALAQRSKRRAAGHAG